MRDRTRIGHELPPPILLDCTDDAGHPVLGPVQPGPGGKLFLRFVYHDIPIVGPRVREFWMPRRARI
ncbi:MAG: hypothetical protein ACREFU_18465 [Acetobacteraceae bacterium]